jgi:PAS domain S-box-containing protein
MADVKEIGEEIEFIDVLMVEDSPTDVFLTKEALREYSRFRVSHASRLGDAIKILDEKPISIVLLDLGLPDSQGLETLSTLCRHAPRVPVIVLTSRDDEELAIDSAQLGAYEFLVKSQIQDGNLRRCIRYVLERHRARSALRASEEHLRAIIDSTPQCIALIHEDGTVLKMNPAGLRMLEADGPESVIGQSFARWIAPELHDACRAFHKAVCRGEAGNVAFEIISCRGSRRNWEAVAVPLPGPDGKTVDLAIAQDVTERVRAEAEQHLRDRAIQAVTQGIVISDPNQPDSPIIFVNPGFERMTGYAAAEVIGKNCRFLQGPDSNLQSVRQLRQAVRSGSACAVEILNYRKDGQPFWNAISIAPVHDASGAVKHFVGVQRDVTERRKLEEQLRQSQKMEAIGLLAGGVAHDFNNLLGIIMGSCELLDPTQGIEEFGISPVQDITQAAQRAAALTRQLLAFSRKQILDPVVLSLNDVLRDISKMIARLIGEDIDLKLDLFPALWHVKVDRGQIEQVLMNLAVNARDAMPKGGRLTFECSNVTWDENACHLLPDCKPGNYVRIAVSDTGTGMPAEIKSRIFEPFFTTKSAGKGTGLGLSVVHGIVSQSGGYIQVDSEEGVGTSFTLYFPAAMELAVYSPIDTPPLLEKVGTETILLVEDEDVLRNLLRHSLEKRGYAVLEASNGKEALELVAAHDGRLDLLITDVVMPHMGGRQLAESILLNHPEVKVLYMTGYMDDAILRHGINHSTQEVLQKPFLFADLMRKVSLILNSGNLVSSTS